MDNLPNELLLRIFKYLDIQDLIQCRLMCKRFMLLCDEIKITELVLTNKIENMKDFKLRTFISYKSTFRLEKFLKRLHLTGSYSDYDLLNLNSLTQLEEFKFEVEFESEDKRMKVNLPNLKILEIGDHDFQIDERIFHLNTPKLEMLKCCGFDAIYLMSDPNIIKYLEVTFYTQSAEKLRNLEYLQYKCQFDRLNRDILSIHPKLRTLVYNKFDYYDDEDYDLTIETLHYLVEQKVTLNRPELKIYFQSVELVDCKKIDEYESSSSDITFQMMNYNLLCNIICYDDPVDYNELMNLVNDTLPNDFFNKFFNIKHVSVSGRVKNMKHFVMFLKNLDYLKELLLLDSSFLDQNFYDHLHGIGQIRLLTTSMINYEFLFKLKLLERFSTEHSLGSFDMILRLYKELKYVTYTNFYFDGEYISISKNSDCQYSFERYNDTESSMRENVFEKDRMDFDQLVRLVNDYQNTRSSLMESI